MAERYLLLWVDRNRAINRNTIAPLRQAIEDHVTVPRDKVEIDIWLDSSGGDAHAAYKLALMVRAAAAKVRVVIPDFAKSAATLLAVAGDEIYLAPGADLGPLDAQLPDEGSVSGQISALNIARAADEVARDAVEMAVAGGADLLELTGLSRAQTIDAMLSFSSRFSEPLVKQLDPKVVHHAKQTLQVTAKYAERLLHETGCEEASRTAQALVETFPTHGYVISLEEAHDLNLPVKPIAEYEHADLVCKLLRGAEQGARMVRFSQLKEALPPAPKQSAKPKVEAKSQAKKRKRTKGGGSNGGPQNRSDSGVKSNGARSGTGSAV
jgi:hypothetical protein